MTMSAITSTITTLATAFTTTVGGWLDVVEEEPILMFFMFVPFIGLAIGLIKRLISL